MVREPGAQLDFGTFIAYLLPGYLVEILLFCLIDTISIIVWRYSLVPEIAELARPDALEMIIFLVVTGLGAYFLGLVLDVVGHYIAWSSEADSKRIAYSHAIADFEEFVVEFPSDPLKRVLASSSRDPSKEDWSFWHRVRSLFESRKVEPYTPNPRGAFIDSMYYQVASPQLWARQNWHWAFYEFSRQGWILCWPTALVLTTYALAAIVRLSSVSTAARIALSIVAGLLSVGLVGVILYRFFIKHRDQNCESYYRHRAWVVLAYLVENDVLAKAREDKGKKEGDEILRLSVHIPALARKLMPRGIPPDQTSLAAKERK